MTIDWMNPTMEMLAGLQAGRDEMQQEMDDQNGRLAMLEQERDWLKAELEEERHKHMAAHCLMAGYQAGADNWHKRAGDAEAALLKYGQHRVECNLYPLDEPSPAACDCGFHELLYKLIELIKEDKDREKKWADAGAIKEAKEKI